MVSASGRLALVKVGLQYELRRDTVARHLAPFPPGSRLAQARAAARVVKRSSQSVTGSANRCSSCAREASRAGSHRVRCTVGMRRQPDHQQRRLPFGEQRFDCAESLPGRGVRRSSSTGARASAGSRRRPPRCAACRSRRQERSPREARRSMAVATTSQACPTASDRREKSMPRSFIAAGSRTSGGSANSTSASAATVSHAFWAISCSS